MRSRDLAGDGETKADSFGAIARGIGTMETLEDFFAICLGNARTAVGGGDAE